MSASFLCRRAQVDRRSFTARKRFGAVIGNPFVVQKIGVPNNPVRNQINTAQSTGTMPGSRRIFGFGRRLLERAAVSAGAEGVMAGLPALEAAVRNCAMISMQPILGRYPLALPRKS